MVALCSVSSVIYSIMQQNIPTILSVRLNRAYAYVCHWLNERTSRISNLISSQQPISYTLSGDTRRRTLDPSSKIYASNTGISIGHSVPIEILITTTHNPCSLTRCTTLLAPLTFHPVSTLLLIHAQKQSSNTIYINSRSDHLPVYFPLH